MKAFSRSSERSFFECQPYFVLLLAWNIAHEITSQQNEYRARRQVHPSDHRDEDR